MITVIQLADGTFAGQLGEATTVAAAKTFTGRDQRNEAWSWLGTQVPYAKFSDVLSIVSPGERGTKDRVSCATCSKVLQNGTSGRVSHGICGACSKVQYDNLMALDLPSNTVNA